jgi:hypothetical protein
MMRRLAAVLCLALATVPLSMTSATAVSTRTFADPTGDLASGMDIQRVSMNYGNRLSITIQHRIVTDGNRVRVWLDRNPRRYGPELLLTGRLGAKYSLYEAAGTDHGWFIGDRTNQCSHDMNVSYVRDTTQVFFGRACLSSRVRIAVDAGRGERWDYAPNPGSNLNGASFSGWVSG